MQLQRTPKLQRCPSIAHGWLLSDKHSVTPRLSGMHLELRVVMRVPSGHGSYVPSSKHAGRRTSPLTTLQQRMLRAQALDTQVDTGALPSAHTECPAVSHDSGPLYPTPYGLPHPVTQ
jgi:hypothetical protein